jgi:hypothetical protein
MKAGGTDHALLAPEHDGPKRPLLPRPIGQHLLAAQAYPLVVARKSIRKGEPSQPMSAA